MADNDQVGDSGGRIIRRELGPCTRLLRLDIIYFYILAMWLVSYVSPLNPVRGRFYSFDLYAEIVALLTSTALWWCRYNDNIQLACTFVTLPTILAAAYIVAAKYRKIWQTWYVWQLCSNGIGAGWGVMLPFLALTLFTRVPVGIEAAVVTGLAVYFVVFAVFFADDSIPRMAVIPPCAVPGMVAVSALCEHYAVAEDRTQDSSVPKHEQDVAVEEREPY